MGFSVRRNELLIIIIIIFYFLIYLFILVYIKSCKGHRNFKASTQPQLYIEGDPLFILHPYACELYNIDACPWYISDLWMRLSWLLYKVPSPSKTGAHMAA